MLGMHKAQPGKNEEKEIIMQILWINLQSCIIYIPNVETIQISTGESINIVVYPFNRILPRNKKEQTGNSCCNRDGPKTSKRKRKQKTIYLMISHEMTKKGISTGTICIRGWLRLEFGMDQGTDCKWAWGSFWGWWKSSKFPLWWQLYQPMKL